MALKKIQNSLKNPMFQVAAEAVIDSKLRTALPHAMRMISEVGLTDKSARRDRRRRRREGERHTDEEDAYSSSDDSDWDRYTE